MKRRCFLAAGPLLLSACRSAGLGKNPDLPKSLMDRVPATSRQVVMVVSPREEAIQGRLWRLERSSPAADWSVVQGPLPVVVGRNGLAWGVGELMEEDPPKGGGVSWRRKREGDGCAPAGVFRLPMAFGRAPVREASWVRLPYVQTTATLRGVDDPASRFYNQIVDAAKLPGGAVPDWRSSETMDRKDGLYDWGVFVGHNHPRPMGGPEARGSCIFLHRWSSSREGTAGCTAMSGESLIALLRWLDPAADPVLVQTVASP